MLLLSLEQGELPSPALVNSLKQQFVLAQQRLDEARLTPLFGQIDEVINDWAMGRKTVDEPWIELLLAVTDFLRQLSRENAAALQDSTVAKFVLALQQLRVEHPNQERTLPVPLDHVGLPRRIPFQRQSADSFSRNLARILDYGSRLRQQGTSISLSTNHGREEWEGFQSALGELNQWAMKRRQIQGVELAQQIADLAHEVATRYGREIQVEVQDRGVDWGPEWVEPLLNALEIWFDFVLGTALDTEVGVRHLLIWFTTEAPRGYAVRIKDDGQGLDPQQVFERAAALGMVDPAHVALRDYGTFIFDRRWSFSDQLPESQRLFELRRIVHGVGGQLALASRLGKGMLCELKFPPVSALFEGVEVATASHRAVIPLFFLQEIRVCLSHELVHIRGGEWSLTLRGKTHRAFLLESLMGGRETDLPLSGMALMTEYDGRSVALLVDRVEEPHTGFLKKLEDHYQRIYGVLGVSLLSSGEGLPVLNISELLESVWSVQNF